LNKVSHDSETPAHGQQVHSACAFIHYDFDGVTKVFLPKRAETKKFLPGLYELPGGHIELYEDIRDGLQREIREECGKDITLGDPFSVFTYENQIKGSHTIEVIYFARFIGSIANIATNPEDHSGYNWFSEGDVIARRLEIVPTEHVIHAHENDPEYLTILKGFKLLRGEQLNFG
jgi:8-oxo-dGTP pyrophosphatase MutT (NUDIX family)